MRSVVLVLVLCFGSHIFAEGQVQPDKASNLSLVHPVINVVAVGVTDYAATKYQPGPQAQRADTVGGQIERRCTDIDNFFKRTYGDRASVRLLCKSDLTTKPALERFFARDFPRLAANTLSVVFFMSHGEEFTFAGPSLVSPDLHIVTSDTTDDDSDLTSISVTRDVMHWLESPPPGATVIVFIDTCHSGAFQNLQVKRIGDLANEYGLYLNIMASSLPKDNSFAGSFTKAILKIWESKELCLSDAGLLNRVRNMVQSYSPISLEDFEGRPITIVRYQGTSCLFSPMSDDRLLLLYAGNGLPETIYRVVSSVSNQVVWDGDLIGKSYEYVRLPKGQYEVTITERDQRPFTKHVDLGNTITEIVFVQPHPGSVSDAQAYSLAADGALRIGHTASEVGELREAAARIYAANGKQKEAQDELAKLDKPMPNAAEVFAAADRALRIEVENSIARVIARNKAFATDTHQLKITAQNGIVTLKGPVRSEEERKAVEAKAVEIAGSGKVFNELTVSTTPLLTLKGTVKVEGDNVKFISDGSQKSWTIMNPEAVRAHEGHHVQIRGHINADRQSLKVAGIKTLPGTKNEASQ